VRIDVLGWLLGINGSVHNLAANNRKRGNMKITFTKEQYETLLKTVYMGNWIANSTSEEPEENPFDALEEYVFSFAKDFGLERYAAYVKENNTYYPSRQMEEDEEVEEYIQNYDDNTFWDKLIFNLSRRDVEKKYGEAAVEKMSDEELIRDILSPINRGASKCL